MTPKRWRDVERVMHVAMSCAATSRSALLDRECGRDKPLRREVESLLTASSSAGDFLEEPVVLLRPANATHKAVPFDGSEHFSTAILDRIGGYRIIRRLGAGGMGVVYLAEQQQPRRTVALKVIRSDKADSAGRLRFAREAEALGRLQHPGIGNIYESGYATVAGDECAFIAMEYIDGPALNEYVRRFMPDARQRLHLFAQICDSVQHAHQNGVIHRDVKPANILIVGGDAASEDKPIAKVVDFGVARITEGRRMAATVTAAEQIVGTLLYMSPEQIAGGDIDTRADVYSLGVVGYELLCGKPPFDADEKSPADLIHTIGNETPYTLSDRHLDADLKTIFSVALEKDSRRRYASAAALADDVRRYLKNEPIAARPPSAAYQLRMFVRRHRGLVVGMIAAFVGWTGGTGFAVVKAIEAGRERDRAVKAEQSAERESEEADIARRRAESEAATATAVTGFLRDTLSVADPDVAERSNATIRDALEQAAAKIPVDLADRPNVEADVRLTIGETYRSLGLFSEAAEHLERSLALAESLSGRRSLKVACVLHSLGVLHRDLGRNDESLAYLEECLEIRRELLTSPDGDLATAEAALAATLVRLGRHNEAIKRHRLALRMRRDLPDYQRSVAESLSSLAIALRFVGQYKEAEANYREALEIRTALHRADHPHIAVARHNLGCILNEMGRFEEAVESVELALEIARRNYAGLHPHIANYLSSYAYSLSRLGRIEEAETALFEALDIQRRLFPDGGLDMVKTLVGLADLPTYRADVEKTLPLLNEADILAARYGGPEDKSAVVFSLAKLFLNNGEADRAESLLFQRLEVFGEEYGTEHVIVADLLMTLAEAELAQGKLDAALEHLKRAMEVYRSAYGEPHPKIGLCAHNLAFVYHRSGIFTEANAWFRDAMKQRRETIGPAHVETLDTGFQLAWVLYDMNQLQEAATLFIETLDRYLTLPGEPAAVRAAECALLLRMIANADPGAADLQSKTEEAIDRATDVLGAEHEYLSKITARIDQLRQEPRH